MTVMVKRFAQGLLHNVRRKAGLVLALVVMANVLPVSAEVPQSTEDNNARLQQQRGGGQVIAPQGRPQPQIQQQFQRPQPQVQQQYQRPQPQVQQQYQRPQPQYRPQPAQQYERGPRFGYDGGYEQRRIEEPRPYYRRPGYAYEEPGYGRRRDFGRACATSRGVCYVRPPQPLGAPCRCEIPGFGLKRGNIEG